MVNNSPAFCHLRFLATSTIIYRQESSFNCELIIKHHIIDIVNGFFHLR
ncbi:hypothetical protein PTE_00552 [Photorhabdus khanii NC19]|uniref:Uncharacterized protein n=1 Tax=Photorhabdus khanii NC19 TaxID=1004151 RepID=W3VC34_9GAMM|nr:hypothetical protein PTE_00552 [Photorhabdus khanii NC19]